jgi:hypothetical protein
MHDVEHMPCTTPTLSPPLLFVWVQAPKAVTRPSSDVRMHRLPGLFREMEREMNELSRSFFGNDFGLGLLPRRY